MVQLGHQESERVALRPWMEALGALFPKVEMEAAETLESRLICL